MSEHAADWPVETTGYENGKLGMWLFLASEVMFFTALIGSYLVLRLASPSWPEPTKLLNIPLLGVNTFVLLASSFSMAQSLHAIRHGDVRGMRRWMAGTIVLGALFLALKGVDWAHLIHSGTTIGSGLFGSVYFLLTGFHGLHVLAGLFALAWTWWIAPGYFSASRWERVECIGLYWHFVDIVWILLFVILCLL